MQPTNNSLIVVPWYTRMQTLKRYPLTALKHSQIESTTQSAAIRISFPGATQATKPCSVYVCVCVFAGKSVKMAVLIRRRIRAVVFNQSRHWQDLRCSRGDCDDDSRRRGKAPKIHAHSDLFWTRQSLLSDVCAESSIMGKEAKLQKHTGLDGHAAGAQARGYSQVLVFLAYKAWHCPDM